MKSKESCDLSDEDWNSQAIATLLCVSVLAVTMHSKAFAEGEDDDLETSPTCGVQPWWPVCDRRRVAERAVSVRLSRSGVAPGALLIEVDHADRAEESTRSDLRRVT
jgi:hypothetical protein